MNALSNKIDLPVCLTLIAHPHLLVLGHHRTVSTNKGCNQWLLLTKILLKVALAGGNHLLVARTSKCGRAIKCTKTKCVLGN